MEPPGAGPAASRPPRLSYTASRGDSGPSGRTTLAMGSHGGLPRAFAAVHPRFASPKVGTIMTGLAGAVVYVVMNFLSHGYVIVDAVSSCGLMIAFAPHWHVGGVFLIGAGAFACGLLAMAVWSRLSPGFFAGRLAQPEEAPEGATEPVTA